MLTFPPRMVATEAWPANAQRARELLAPRGVVIIESIAEAPDESFELVLPRANAARVHAATLRGRPE